MSFPAVCHENRSRIGNIPEGMEISWKANADADLPSCPVLLLNHFIEDQGKMFLTDIAYATIVVFTDDDQDGISVDHVTNKTQIDNLKNVFNISWFPVLSTCIFQKLFVYDIKLCHFKHKK